MSTKPDRTPPASITRVDPLDPAPALALAGILNTDPPGRDEPLPPLWHCVYFLNRARQRSLGPDGHPIDAIPAPPGPGMRRMFAGGRVHILSPLRFDVGAEETTTIVRTDDKQGRSGSLRFVTVRSTIRQDQRVAMVEEKDIVYRRPDSRLEAAVGNETNEAIKPSPRDLTLETDPVVLFRFSAVTYNSHRIHYDKPYAESEGYPGLVVHGPLQALLMAERLRLEGVSFTGQIFYFRLLAPAFSGRSLVATREAATEGVAARVHDTQRTTATATLKCKS